MAGHGARAPGTFARGGLVSGGSTLVTFLVKPRFDHMALVLVVVGRGVFRSVESRFGFGAWLPSVAVALIYIAGKGGLGSQCQSSPMHLHLLNQDVYA